MRRLLTGCCLLFGLSFAQVAHAYEDQLTLGVGAGYGYAGTDTLPRHGALFDLTASFGLDSVWSVRGRASYAVHPESRPLHVGMLGGDLLYLIDVLEIVPYFGAGAGGALRVRDGDGELDAEAHLVVGIDYLLSRTLALELEARPYLLVSELDGDPFYFAAAAAVVFVFDD